MGKLINTKIGTKTGSKSKVKFYEYYSDSWQN